MKTMKILSICLLGCILAAPPLHSQVNPLKKIKQKTDKKLDREMDKALDKVFSKKDTKKDEEKVQDTDKVPEANNPGQPANQSPEAVIPESKPELKWAKYDFVPGDKIIFEDNLLGEENGEFPSRWDFRSGNVEVAEFGGENVIMFRDGAPEIIPYMKTPGKDYLPDVFTIEFDLYVGNDNFVCYLFDRKNQKSGSPTGYTGIAIRYYKMEIGRAVSELPEKDKLAKRRWVHVAIAYTNGKLKAYMDETRLINLPRLDFDPRGISLYIYHARNDNLYYVKNVRIAEGGVKYYDRFLQDGKIVSNAIRFDVGKATLLPESMGAVNEIYGLLEEHPEIKFSIEGHTDSDGDFDTNQKLSEDRAKTVMDQLISMGIDENRLSFRGFGETTPVDTNNTPEGKASNRRVEFVKTN